jgi:hypothetical protein
MGRTILAVFTRADGIAGDQSQKSSNPFQIDPVFLEKAPQTLEPHNVVGRVIAVSIATYRMDETILLIDS